VASHPHCDLVVAMIVDRLIAPRSKLGFVRAVDRETASIGRTAGAVEEREAYEALAPAAENGPLQLSQFDERDLAEISAPEMFPGEVNG
jgi:hypothetical protein